MTVAYRIETARLVIRCACPGDAALRKQAMDASIAHLTVRGRQPKPHEPVDAHVAHARKCRGMFDLDQDQVFALLDPTGQRFFGEVGLLTRAGPAARELGYWVRVEDARSGLITEAACAVVRVAFELLGIERLDIRCGVDNVASAGVARKLGFVLEGTLRHRRNRPEEVPSDDLAFSMLRHDFEASLAAHAAIRAFDIVGTPIPLADIRA